MAKDTGDSETAFGAERSPGRLLHRAQQIVEERYAALSKEKILTFRQYTLLSAIAAHPDQTQTDLVGVTGIDRSTLAEMTSRLEERDLIEREKSLEDGRAKRVRLTRKGRQRLNEAAPVAEAADQALLDLVPRDKQRAFLGMLHTIAIAAEEAERKREEEAARAKREAKLAKNDKKSTKARKPDKATKGSKKPEAKKLDSKKPVARSRSKG